MYRWLVPRIIWPLSERLVGRRMWTEMCRLRELQWRPTAELEARALDRLRALLTHATMHVPYYRDLFQAGGDPARRHTDTSRSVAPPGCDESRAARRLSRPHHGGQSASVPAPSDVDLRLYGVTVRVLLGSLMCRCPARCLSLLARVGWRRTLGHTHHHCEPGILLYQYGALRRRCGGSHAAFCSANRA